MTVSHGEVCNYSASFCDMKDCCAPSSSNMLARQRWGPVRTSATAVFRRHLMVLGDVRLWLEDDTGTSICVVGTVAVETLVVVVPVVVVAVSSLSGCDCELLLASQRLEWCFLLQNLQRYFDWHCETL